MLTAGFTYYPDQEKTWSLSALNRYEINQERKDPGVTPGQQWTLEWGIAKNFAKKVDLGMAGYFQMQTTDFDPDTNLDKQRIVGIGPEITFPITQLGVSTSIRYLREVGAQQRPEGNTFNITFTKRLGPAPK